MRYKAFISYSHTDERWGARLHRRLETFRIPRRLIGQETENGPVPQALKPVFRDKVELSAGADLSEALQRRLEESETLIVLCSPNAAKSFWVNEEILYFKRHNNPDNIFAFIIDGEPNAEHPDNECFPEALRFRLDKDGRLSEERAEPLAADARSQGDGERAALLRLVSGMIGVGFDDLVRRDLQRARRRVTGITVTAISAMLVMGTLTGVAMDARSEAEARKNDAEGLIEFMLTDLRDKLEPVGRIDVLKDVGFKASEYYQDLDEHDSDEVGRKARVYHLLSEVYLEVGNVERAESYADLSYNLTQAQLKQNPNNPDRVFEHAQSTFWKSMPYRKRLDQDGAFTYRQEYVDLAEQLRKLDPNSKRTTLESAWAYSGIGHIKMSRGLDLWLGENREEAENVLRQALKDYQLSESYFRKALEFEVRNRQYLMRLANCLEAQASAHWYLDNLEQTKSLRIESYEILSQIHNENPNDYFVLEKYTFSLRGLAGIYQTLGELEKSLELFQRASRNMDRLIARDPSIESIQKLKITTERQLVEVLEELHDKSENQLD